MTMWKKAEYVRRSAFMHKTKFKQVIADANMTFQGTRGAKHGAQPWQKHHFRAKEFMRKFHKKRNIYVDS